jgi:MerR family transcriptional regulator, Zn(II)-responsive regulator of zntA
MDRLLTIGELADLRGVSASTIRYYEQRRLLRPPQRTAAGYRLYPKAMVQRLTLVRNAQRFGFSLTEIARFLRIRDGGGRPCHDVRARAQGILEAVDRQIKELLTARRSMRRTLREWDRMLSATPPNRPARLLDALARQNQVRDRSLASRNA